MPVLVVVLIVLLSLGAVMVLLSASPGALWFSVEYPGDGGALVITWLWGLARFRPGSGSPGKKEKRKEKKADRKGKKRIKDPRALLAPKVRRAAFRVLPRLLRRIEVRRLRLHLSFGLGDPADTAFLFGALLPLTIGFESLPLGELRIDPRFDEEVIKIEGEGAVQVIPIMVVGTALGTFFRRDGWVILRALKESMWNTRNA